jgi:DnaJ-class molecular chaperone
MTKRKISSLFLILVLSLAFFVQGVLCEEDFYNLLEIPRQATKADIKKAYRSLSMKYHPDKNPGDEAAAEHYKKVNRAYEVLSDENKR